MVPILCVIADTDNPFSLAISVMLFPSKTTDVNRSTRSSLILVSVFQYADTDTVFLFCVTHVFSFVK